MSSNPAIVKNPNLLQQRLKEGTLGQVKESSYAGADILAYINIPLLDDPTQLSSNTPSARILGEIQTISISSTRSISPVRTLGRSNPIGYTRGGRTFAGTLVFAAFGRDVFSDLYRPDIVESFIDSSTSLFVDQLPPFSIIITASNELGGLAQQIISGITLVNYGVTYSIDDIYTEVSYTYVATDVTPLLPIQVMRGLANRPSYKTPLDIGITDLPNIKSSDRNKFDGTSQHIKGLQNILRGSEAINLEQANGLIQDEYFWTRNSGRNTIQRTGSRQSLRDSLR